MPLRDLRDKVADVQRNGRRGEPFNRLPRDGIAQDWDRIRAMIEHEDGLINQRMTWLGVINAFLFTAFFSSQRTDGNDAMKLLSAHLSWGVPAAGIMISASILVALVAAMNQLNWLSEWWKWRKSFDRSNYSLDARDMSDLRHPRIVGFKSKSSLSSHDLVIALILPGIIIVAWAAILVGEVVGQFYPARPLFPMISMWAAVLASVAAIVLALIFVGQSTKAGPD